MAPKKEIEESSSSSYSTSDSSSEGSYSTTESSSQSDSLGNSDPTSISLNEEVKDNSKPKHKSTIAEIEMEEVSSSSSSSSNSEDSEDSEESDSETESSSSSSSAPAKQPAKKKAPAKQQEKQPAKKPAKEPKKEAETKKEAKKEVKKEVKVEEPKEVHNDDVENQYYPISINDPVKNSAQPFPSNVTRTTKYTAWSFLFKVLYEQYKKITNVTNINSRPVMFYYMLFSFFFSLSLSL